MLHVLIPTLNFRCTGARAPHLLSKTKQKKSTWLLPQLLYGVRQIARGSFFSLFSST